jgi:hypothetical protein
MYARNVGASAFVWVQGILDAGVVTAVAVLVVAMTVEPPLSAFLTLGASVAYVIGSGIAYSRLPTPMRRLARRGRNPALTRLNIGVLVAVLGFLAWTAATEGLASPGRAYVTPLLLWAAVLVWRLRMRFGPRLHQHRQRRRYRSAVFGPGQHPHIVAPRKPVD